jgi:hypothetical protein
MSIDARFIVNLKGREYPTYPGILDAATTAGLQELTTRIIQIPAAENGHVAIVMARAEFADGRVFEDVGDASPANCATHILPAALRMASTRAKGRCLRDAINCGMTLLEEEPEEPAIAPATPPPVTSGPREAGRRTKPASEAPADDTARFCEQEGCGLELTKHEILGNTLHFAGEHWYCTPHGREALKRGQENQTTV